MSNSLEEVAVLAGVSPATVSRALRGLPRVSPATRAKVVQAAEAIGYVISPNASRLASGRTHTIGVVVPYVSRWFFGQAITGAERVLRDQGFDLLLYNLGDEPSRERFFQEMPLRRRVDGVLVLTLPLTESEVDRLRQLRVPVALLGASVEPFACVRIDDVAAATTAVQHLTNLGHRDIALICGEQALAKRFTAPADRRQAYIDVLSTAGVTYDPELEAVGDFTVAAGQRAMEQLLGRSRRPTAVFAQSDEMAFGALRALRLSGLTVPDSMSVVGFDNHDMADLLDLTTIGQPVVQQGELCAQLLLDRIAGGDQPKFELRLLPTRLIVRGSTAPVTGAYQPQTTAPGSPM